jgi:hypothetical protein
VIAAAAHSLGTVPPSPPRFIVRPEPWPYAGRSRCGDLAVRVRDLSVMMEGVLSFCRGLYILSISQVRCRPFEPGLRQAGAHRMIVPQNGLWAVRIWLESWLSLPRSWPSVKIRQAGDGTLVPGTRVRAPPATRARAQFALRRISGRKTRFRAAGSIGP